MRKGTLTTSEDISGCHDQGGGGGRALTGVQSRDAAQHCPAPPGCLRSSRSAQSPRGRGPEAVPPAHSGSSLPHPSEAALLQTPEGSSRLLSPRATNPTCCRISCGLTAASRILHACSPVSWLSSGPSGHPSLTSGSKILVLPSILVQALLASQRTLTRGHAEPRLAGTTTDSLCFLPRRNCSPGPRTQYLTGLELQ